MNLADVPDRVIIQLKVCDNRDPRYLCCPRITGPFPFFLIGEGETYETALTRYREEARRGRDYAAIRAS